MATLTTGNDSYKLTERLRSVNRNHNIRLSEEMSNSIRKNIFTEFLIDKKTAFPLKMEFT